ncbi:hypothetical protein ACNOYE_05260 [Nannocystaceae bacterium ST9]
MRSARPLALALTLVLAACVSAKGKVTSEPPLLEPQPGVGLRPIDVALPMHDAAIVDLGFVEPRGALSPEDPAKRWRLMSVDELGWIRVWEDGKLIMATPAHHGGATALVQGPDGIPFTAGLDGRVIEWSRNGERIERVLQARAPVVPVKPSKPDKSAKPSDPNAEPAPELAQAGKPRPIVALAVARDRLAISDGHWVQVWSREPTPVLIWSHHSHSFVSGLALARDGSSIAMAMLREEAMRQGVADHPLAEFPEPRVNKRDEARAQELADRQELVRMQARVDRPGATADLVEVHALSGDWDVTLEPLAPIDPDMAMPEEGLLIYREVYSPEQTRVIGRSIGDKLHLGVRVGVIATTPGPDDLTAPEDPGEALADFAFGRGVDSEKPPIGMRLEPFDSLPVAGRRELAIGSQYWAAGDEHGQLVIGPREGGELEWLPASEPIELISAAAHQPWLVTSGLEQPVRVRRWQIAEGEQRLVGMILPPAFDPDTGQTPPALYPVELAIDDSGNRVAVSSWSFSAEESSELRLFDLGGGTTKVVEQIATPSGLSISIAAAGDELWSWHRGSLARAFTGAEWASSTSAGLGRPLASSEARWLAFAAHDRRQIYDRQDQRMVQDQKVDADLPSEFVAAVASDGTLAVVSPIGGGTIERLHPSEGVLEPITTFGPVTALDWIPSPSGGPDTLLIGQAEGSIDMLEPGAVEPRPLRPAEGGRVWALAGVGGSPGSFVELDEEGLWIHRTSDGASLRVALASPEPRVSGTAANPSPPTGATQGLVVIWRASTGAPACRVFDATRAGVVVGPNVRVEREQPTLLKDFLAGVVECAPPPEEALEGEDVPDDEVPAPAEEPPAETPVEDHPSIQKPHVPSK